MRHSHTTYLLGFLLFLLPVVAVAGINYLYLRHTGEFLTLQEIISKQETDPNFCIYGTALHNDTFTYKELAYSEKKPDVAVVGSSLMMQIRDRFFSGSFYSMAGTTDSVINGINTTSLMTASHKPKLLLFGVDWWWFRGSIQPYQRSHPPTDPPRFTIAKVFEPLSWIASGKLRIGDYIATVLGREKQDGPCAIGVQSMEKRRGFGPDGSYYYTSIITGKEPTPSAPHFATEKKDILQGTGHFGFDDTINQQSFDEFLQMVHSLQSQGITVVLFIPPVPSEVYSALQQSNRFGFIPKFFAALHGAGISYFNFMNPASIGSPDCEFVDGVHGGDVTYARILRKIYDALPDPKLRSLFDIATIDRTIKEDAGLAMAKDPRVTTDPETDFLQLGCRKTANTLPN